MREIGGLDGIAALEKHRFLGQLHSLEMWQERFQFIHIERCQKVIRYVRGLSHAALLPWGGSTVASLSH